MAFLIVYILDNTGQMPDILEAWEQAGAARITILDSTGLERLRRTRLREDLPLMPSLADLLVDESVYHKTLLTVIEDEATVDGVVDATRQIVGDFSQHHTGILCVLPVLRVYGLDKPG